MRFGDSSRSWREVINVCSWFFSLVFFFHLCLPSPYFFLAQPLPLLLSLFSRTPPWSSLRATTALLCFCDRRSHSQGHHMGKETKQIKDSGDMQRAGNTVGLQILKIGLANKFHHWSWNPDGGGLIGIREAKQPGLREGFPLICIQWTGELILALVSTLGQVLCLDIDILKLSPALTLPWLSPH